LKAVRASSNNLTQLALAMHTYHDLVGNFPPAALREAAGKSILSWRVAILPYIEQDELYKQFKLDEPWDSENNKKLIAKMPKVFQGAGKKRNDEGKTSYLVPVGKNTIFPLDGEKVTLLGITDGSTNTILIVEANDESAVIWTKPDDLVVDLKQPFRDLERNEEKFFLAAMADGSVKRIRFKHNPAEVAAAFTRNGGENVGLLEQPERKIPDRPKTEADIVNDMKQIGLAMHNQHDVNGRLPPAVLRDPNGKPLLSWRVAMLPYIEQQNLYNQFNLNEPWDGPTNKKLIAQMPRLFKGLNQKLNEEGKTSFVVPVGTGTMFPPDGQAIQLTDVTDGTSFTIMCLLANDDAAVIWTKPDDLNVDRKNPLKGLERQGQPGFLAGMADGSVRNFRATIDATKLAGLFTRAGGEVVEITSDDELHVPSGPGGQNPFIFAPSEDDLRRFEEFGLDLNKLRRFLRDGIGDQVGLQMHDASNLFDFDMAGAFGGQADGGLGLSGSTMFGIGLLVQFVTGPSSLSIPVKDAKAVDEFLDEVDRLTIKMKAESLGEFGRLSDFVEFYRMPFPKPHTIRCHVIKFAGLKWRLYWGRIGNGLYFANRPFILEDIAAAQDDKQQKKRAEAAHALVRLRPENWKEVLPGYNLSWAEAQRTACHRNLSMLANVYRGWNDRQAQDEAPDAALVERVARLYGVRPFCPDGGKYTLSADGKSCQCSVHGDSRDPRQPAAPTENSATARLLKTFGGLRASLTFEQDGLRAVVTLERKD
jgi:Protein of unknown function (DUF1559)